MRAFNLYHSSQYPDSKNQLEDPSLFIQQSNEKIKELNSLKDPILILGILAALASYIFCRLAINARLNAQISVLMKLDMAISGGLAALTSYIAISKLNQFLPDFRKIKESVNAYPRHFCFLEKKSFLSDKEFEEMRACFPKDFDLKKPALAEFKSNTEWTIQGGHHGWCLSPLSGKFKQCPPVIDNGEEFKTYNKCTSGVKALLFVARAKEIPPADRQMFIQKIILFLDPNNLSPFASLPVSQDSSFAKIDESSTFFQINGKQFFCPLEALPLALAEAYGMPIPPGYSIDHIYIDPRELRRFQ